MDIFDLKATLKLDDTQYTEKLEKAPATAQKAGKEIGKGLNSASQIGKSAFGFVGEGLKTMGSVGIKAAEAIGKGLQTAAKVGSIAFGAATTAVGALGKSAISSYAEYEQLAGGVEKLYGDAADKLKAFADQAYMTAGMSANEYMNTATSFSAALINSLGGDVDKAADMTDLAMRAMSDNVNIFGSDMESVSNAFKGFAKQNYTMLDNLKLGYGGTQSEMERLIADANAWGAANGEASNLSIDSFADVVTAINQIQKAQNIAGTTQKEAMRTIEGAANATKAAWKNVITAIGRGEGLKEALDGLTTSLFGEDEETGLLNQIIPRIETVMEGIGTFIETAGPYITDKLPKLINSVVPTLIKGGMTLLSAFGKGFIQALPDLTYTIMDAVEMVLQALVDATANGGGFILDAISTILGIFEENYTHFIDMGLEIMTNILQGMVSKLPAVIDFFLLIIEKIGTSLTEYAPILISAVGDIISTITGVFMEHLPDMLFIGIGLLESILEGLVEASANSDGFILQVIDWILGVFGQNGYRILEMGAEILVNLVTGMIEQIPNLLNDITNIIEMMVNVFTEYFPTFVEVGLTLITTLAESLAQNISIIIPPVIEMITTIVTTLTEPNTLTKLLDAALTVIMALANGLIDALPQLIDAAITIVENIATFLIDNIDKVVDAAIEIMDALADGILEAIPVIIDATIEVVTRLVDKLTEDDTLDKLIDAAIEIIIALADGLIKALPKLIEATITLITKLIEKLTDPETMGKLVDAALKIILALAEGLIKAIPQLLKAIPKIIVAIFNAILDALPKIFEAGGELLKMFKDGIVENIPNLIQAGIDLVDGLWQGIHDKWGDLVQGAINLGNDFLEVVKWIFGIASPSKEFAKIGEFCVAGFDKAFDGFGDDAIDEIEDTMDQISKVATPDFEVGVNGSANGDSEMGQVVPITINVYGAEGQDEEVLAEKIANKINHDILKERMARGGVA